MTTETMTDAELDRASYAKFQEAVAEMAPCPNESALMRSTDERDVDRFGRLDALV